jgi:hypothetical protein
VRREAAQILRFGAAVAPSHLRPDMDGAASGAACIAVFGAHSARAAARGCHEPRTAAGACDKGSPGEPDLLSGVISNFSLVVGREVRDTGHARTRPRLSGFQDPPLNASDLRRPGLCRGSGHVFGMTMPSGVVSVTGSGGSAPAGKQIAACPMPGSHVAAREWLHAYRAPPVLS